MHNASIRKVKVGEKLKVAKKESCKKVKVFSWKVKLQKVKVTREKVIVKLNSATATIGCFDHRCERMQLYNVVSFVRLFGRFYLLLWLYFCFEIVICHFSILQLLNQLARRVERANCYALNITCMQSYFVACLQPFIPNWINWQDDCILCLSACARLCLVDCPTRQSLSLFIGSLALCL